MAESDWELGTGFAIDGMTGTIVAMEFIHDNALGPNACAKITFGECVDPDGNEAEDQEQKFTVGKNYDNDRTGENLVGQGKINGNTNFGILIGSVLGLFGDDGTPAGLAAARAAANEAVPSTKEAAAWIGTRWTLGTITKATLNPSTGKMRDDAQKVVFTEYHGRPDEGGETAVAPATAKKAAPKPASGGTKVGAKAAPAAAKAVNGVEAELWATMVALADEHDDEDAFTDAVLELTEVQASREAQKSVMKGLVWAAKS